MAVLTVFTATFTPAGAAAGEATPRDLALDVNGDLDLVDGDFRMLTGGEAIASDLRARLQTWAGEYFLDTSLGVPWLSDVFGKAGAARAEQVLRRAIEETPGVREILRFRLTVARTERTASLDFAVSTDFGEIVVASQEGA